MLFLCLMISEYFSQLFNKLDIKNNFCFTLNFKESYCNYLIKKKNKKNKINNKKLFKNILNDIENRNNNIYKIYENNFYKLLKYKLIILDFKTVYDYKTNETTKKEYIQILSKYCHDKLLIFVIVTELNPNNFPNIEYFNKINLISPFNYKKRTFGSIVRNKLNNYSNTPVDVSINRIINDIMNQYGVNEESFIYINSEKIDNINTMII
jgi:hypothetical protein